MDPDVPAPMVASLERCRQHCPAQHVADFRGSSWALALLGSTRQGMTNRARPWVFVERPRASWARFLAESPWDLRGGSQTLVRHLVQPWGPSVDRWDAWLAAVATTLLPQVRGQRPGVQTWHDHRGDPARGASVVGHHWALMGVVSAWGAGDLGWPLLARLVPGQLKPLGCMAGAEGVPRLDCWAVVVALGRELPP